MPVVDEIISSGSLTEVYRRIDEVAALTNAQIAIAKTALKGSFRDFSARDFRDAVMDARRRARAQTQAALKSNAPAAAPVNSLLPKVVTNNRPDFEIIKEIMSIVVTSNSPPKIFQYSNNLARVCGTSDGESAFIDILNEDSLRGMLSKRMVFITRHANGNERVGTASNLILKAILSRKNWDHIPVLNGIVFTPLIDRHWRIIKDPGYNADLKTYYAPNRDLSKLYINPGAGREEAVAACDLVMTEVLQDFAFKDTGSMANAFGALMTSVLIGSINERIPMCVVSGSKPGTGKSLFCNAISIIASGETDMNVLTPSRQEFEKNLASILKNGRPVTMFDNISQNIKLESTGLDACLTSGTYSFRRMGTQDIIKVPIRTMFMVNGNNVNIGGDMPRRCFWIFMDPKTSSPTQRTGFKREFAQLLKFCKRCRCEVVGCLLTIVQAWINAGRPASSRRVNIGGYNEWGHLITDLLDFVGVPGFLLTYYKQFQEIDEADLEAELFLEKWGQIIGVKPVFLRDIYDLLRLPGEDTVTEFGESLPGHLRVMLDEKRRGEFSLSLGRYLGKICDARFGEKEYSMTKEFDKHTKQKEWKLVIYKNVVDMSKAKKELADKENAGNAN